MTIEQEARDLLKAELALALEQRDAFKTAADMDVYQAWQETMAERDAERQAHADFRQRVSDEAERILTCTNINKRYGACLSLNQFIIPKPVDPLVEAIRDFRSAYVPVTDQEWANDFRAALAKRGLVVREEV